MEEGNAGIEIPKSNDYWLINGANDGRGMNHSQW